MGMQKNIFIHTGFMVSFDLPADKSSATRIVIIVGGSLTPHPFKKNILPSFHSVVG